MYRRYPYTNFHDINLDYILNQIKDLAIAVEEVKSYKTDWDQKLEIINSQYEELYGLYNILQVDNENFKTQVNEEFDDLRFDIETQFTELEESTNNQFTTLKDEVNTQFEELREATNNDLYQLRDEINTQFEELEQSNNEYKADLLNQFNDLRVELENNISDLTSELNTELANYKATVDFRVASLTNEVARMDNKLNEVLRNLWMNITMVNPFTGVEESVLSVIDYLASLHMQDGITAQNYDALELTAQVYDDMQINAKDYDTQGDIILRH